MKKIKTILKDTTVSVTIPFVHDDARYPTNEAEQQTVVTYHYSSLKGIMVCLFRDFGYTPSVDQILCKDRTMKLCIFHPSSGFYDRTIFNVKGLPEFKELPYLDRLVDKRYKHYFLEDNYSALFDDYLLRIEGIEASGKKADVFVSGVAMNMETYSKISRQARQVYGNYDPFHGLDVHISEILDGDDMVFELSVINEINRETPARGYFSAKRFEEMFKGLDAERYVVGEQGLIVVSKKDAKAYPVKILKGIMEI